MTVADPAVVRQAAAMADAGTVAPRWPQLIPVAQLLAVVLGVMAIIWNQQQTTDSLRTELRAEISQLETKLGTEIGDLRVEVSENGQRLARIEGFLGIGVPDDAAE